MYGLELNIWNNMNLEMYKNETLINFLHSEITRDPEVLNRLLNFVSSPGERGYKICKGYNCTKRIYSSDDYCCRECTYEY
jgi:hypothetical protein